jgi:hypothetical protein
MLLINYQSNAFVGLLYIQVKRKLCFFLNHLTKLKIFTEISA